MRKTILFAFVALGSFYASSVTPHYEWSYLYDTKSAQDNLSALLISSDGKLVSIGHFGSKTSEDKFSYNGEDIAVGSAIDGNSDNRNLLVMKHNEDGSKAWAFSSTQGYMDGASPTAVAATSDGGVVMILKTRGSSVSGVLNPVFVNSDGSEEELTDWNTSAWIYNSLIIKLSSEGKMEWSRTLIQDQTPFGSRATTTDAVTPNALVVDDEGNIFVGGNYRTPMVISGAGNACYVLTPRNIATYTGDPQAAAGGMFLVKLDSNGDYLAHLNSTGSLSRDQISAMTVSGGKLYFIGNIQGNVDSELTVGDKSVTLTSSLDGMMAGCCGTDLKMEWLNIWHTVGASDGKSTLQLKNLKAIDGAFYAMGALKGGICAPGESAAKISTASTMLEGFCVKFNSDGTYSDSKIFGKSISAWLNAAKIGEKVCLFGYVLTNGGASLTEWDSETPEYICTSKGATTSYDMVSDPKSNRLYIAVRSNQSFKFGDDETVAPSGFGSVMAAYNIGTATGASDIKALKEVKVEGGEGKITINASSPTNLTISDAAGLVIYDGVVETGLTEIAAKCGVYVAGGNKILVK